MMKTAKHLQKDIEGCELAHPAYKSVLGHLSRRIEDAMDDYASRIEWVAGPSRVGKSMLINALSRAHPQTKENGKRRVPLLVVKLPPGISPLLLPTSVIEALGVPLPPGGLTSGKMSSRMMDQLRLAGTRVVLFDEASHLVDLGSKVPPRAAGDWFKSVADELNITMVLFGVPRLERLFDSNEQLRLRASARIEFRPYDVRVSEEKQAFASCVRTYIDLFERAGWPSEVPFATLAAHCYLLSGGLVGLLSRFAQELAFQVAYEEPRALTLDDFRAVAEGVECAGDPRIRPFQKLDVSPVELHAAHAHVLETNGMSVRRLPAMAGAAL